MELKIPFRKYTTVLADYLRPHRTKLVFLALVIVIRISLTIVNPQIIRYYIDNSISDNRLSTQTLLIAAGIFIAIAFLEQGFILVSVYLGENLAWDTTNQVRWDLMQHCLHLDMSFHNERKPGEMIERIDGDVSTLATFFSTFTILVSANVLLMIAILGALFYENAYIGSIFTLFTLISLTLMYWVSTFSRPYWKLARESRSQVFGEIEERISGLEDIKANAGDAHLMNKYYDRSRTFYSNTFKAALVQSITRIVVFSIVGGGTTLVFIIGIPLFNAEVITIGTIFLISYYISILFQPIFQLLSQVQELAQADASLDRVNELFQTESKIMNTGTLTLDTDQVKVQFDGVKFSYKEGEEVIKNLNFTILPNRVLGLIGHTGSGKTTLSRLIFRLYNIDDGRILINDANIEQYELEELRKDIAMVTQQVELYRTTIRNNITFFDTTIPDNRILEVIEDVGLTDWFQRLPEGLDTEILSDNSGLSSGEAQLLALTRIFLRNPKMVVLDEASSRLDPATEKLIDKSMTKLLHNRTGIVIAHRLATLDKVDDIMIIDQGELVEFGSRADLVKDPNSNFSQLLKTGIEEVLV